MKFLSAQTYRYLFFGLTLALLTTTAAFAGKAKADDDGDGMLADAAIELKVKTALLEKIGWDMLTVDVEAKNGLVVLIGEADNRANQEMAKEVARSVEGVEKVTNRLTVEEPKSKAPVSDAMANAELEVRDALLESRVKAELLAKLGVAAFDIEVEATEGTVSLRGDLEDRRHRELALDTASDIKGVDKVVDLLKIES